MSDVPLNAGSTKGTRPTYRGVRAGAWSVFALAVVAASSAWYVLRPRPLPRLNPNWTAVVTVLAGDGVSTVRDGDPGHARFSDPFGVAAATDGTLVVGDGVDAHRIRRIAADGRVSTLAGGLRGFTDGPATAARFDTPSGVALGADGTVYVADTGNNAIRRIATDGNVSTLAGGGPSGFADGRGREASLNGPIGLAIGPSGDVVVADAYNDRVRLVTADGHVSTLAGNGLFGMADGPAAEARFDTPCGIAVDQRGNVYVADTGNDAVRLIADGVVTTITPLPEGGLFRPTGIAVDPSGTIYVSDEGGRIVEIHPGVSARVLAGAGIGFSDGAGAEARFRAPAGIALIGEARLVVTDRRNALVRVVEGLGRGTLRPPASPAVRPQFDFDRFSQTPLLWPVHPQEGPFEITGTMGEVRGGDTQERFHAGLDVRAEAGAVVRAVRDGVVSDPIATTDFDTLNEALRIGPLVYVHQRVGRSRSELFEDPRLAPSYTDTGVLAQVRVKRGSRYLVGEAIGTVNAFNHVHLNVGWPREEINPLAARLVQFADSVRPVIAARGVHLLDEAGVELKARGRGRLLVSGPVRVVVDAWDQVDGNQPRRRLGLYRLGYQVLLMNGEPAHGFDQPRETLRFDRLLPDENAAQLAYAPGSGIPFFGGRMTRLLYEVTNEMRNGRASPGVWDTDALAPGDYTLRIVAADFSGNEATGNRDLGVTVVAR